MGINTALGTLSPQRDDRLISQTQFVVFDGHTWVRSLKLEVIFKKFHSDEKCSQKQLDIKRANI